MPNYSNAIIYKIFNSEKTYVGSTTQKLSERMSGHRSHLRRYKKGLERACASFQIIDNGKYEYKIIDEYPCENKHQLRDRENLWIEKTENCVNEHKPGSINRAGGLDAYKLKWAQNNPELVKKSRDNRKEKLDKYYQQQIPCPNCGKLMSLRNKAAHMKNLVACGKNRVKLENELKDIMDCMIAQIQ